MPQKQPKIIWILNVSPDSFSDGRMYTRDQLDERITTLIADGADIIDVGAESTAPGSSPISASEELARLEDFFSLAQKYLSDVEFSIDTKKAIVAQRAIQAGVSIINDVSWGRSDSWMYTLVARHPKIRYVLMYCKNASWHADLQQTNTDVLHELYRFFDEQIPVCYQSGMTQDQMIIDPGMWAFISSDPKDSVRVLQSLSQIHLRYELPMLVGTSRKWFLWALSSDAWPVDRIGSSLASSLFASHKGATYLRVHDVRYMRQMLDVWGALHRSF